MFRSIRGRMQIWYAIVLLAVVGGFGGVLYYQVRTYRLGQIDERLEAAVRYLEAGVKILPPHELDDLPPPEGFRRPPPPGRRPPPPRDAARAGLAPDDRPPPDRPPQRGWPPEGPSDERLREVIALPDSLLDRPGDAPQDRPYFAVWRANDTVLASSSERVAALRPDDFTLSTAAAPVFRWQSDGRREAFLVGPRGSVILVGKPIGRELGELRAFAWQTLATGAGVLVIGLAGGWIISRSITRPIAAISRTASAISASNLSRRIETPGIDLELVGLATVLNDMFSRLEAAFVRQSRFTSDASHELRTPLAVIHANVELALSKPRSADEYRQTLDSCLRASSRMASLVDGLLTLARADAGWLDPRLETLDLRPIVEETIDQYRAQAELGKVSLSATLEEPVFVRGDAAFLMRIAGNLLSNAIRYTPAGGRVHVALGVDGQDALLAVEDTGCGISAEDQPHVFERFFRTDKARSRSQGGNGLGLAICKSLVEVHHGRLGFTSVENRGTRFEVRLPLSLGGGAPTSEGALEHFDDARGTAQGERDATRLDSCPRGGPAR